ncbi:zinc ribbon domain-containing protein [Mycolicibacterium sarraceniae]|nr:zinc ribbon domain-containing protein [Mycolicibacterium sarraceniae]
MSKNRYGAVYPYFICLGRHQKTAECTQRAVLIPIVEQRVEEHYQTIQLDQASRDRIEEVLRGELRQFRKSAETSTRQLSTQKEQLTSERMRLLQAHYAGAIPIDLLKTEQDRIARQLASIEERLSAAAMEFDSIERAFRVALDFAVHCHKGYLNAREPERRLFNQALFTKILVDEDRVTVELAEPFRTLFGAAGRAESQDAAVPALQHSTDATEHRSASLTDVPRREINKPADDVAGLNMNTLVPPA